jgi:hypothetical protein
MKDERPEARSRNPTGKAARRGDIVVAPGSA